MMIPRISLSSFGSKCDELTLRHQPLEIKYCLSLLNKFSLANEFFTLIIQG